MMSLIIYWSVCCVSSCSNGKEFDVNMSSWLCYQAMSSSHVTLHRFPWKPLQDHFLCPFTSDYIKWPLPGSKSHLSIFHIKITHMYLWLLGLLIYITELRFVHYIPRLPNYCGIKCHAEISIWVALYLI